MAKKIENSFDTWIPYVYKSINSRAINRIRHSFEDKGFGGECLIQIDGNSAVEFHSDTLTLYASNQEIADLRVRRLREMSGIKEIGIYA